MDWMKWTFHQEMACVLYKRRILSIELYILIWAGFSSQHIQYYSVVTQPYKCLGLSLIMSIGYISVLICRCLSIVLHVVFNHQLLGQALLCSRRVYTNHDSFYAKSNTTYHCLNGQNFLPIFSPTMFFCLLFVNWDIINEEKHYTASFQENKKHECAYFCPCVFLFAAF